MGQIRTDRNLSCYYLFFFFYSFTSCKSIQFLMLYINHRMVQMSAPSFVSAKIPGIIFHCLPIVKRNFSISLFCPVLFMKWAEILSKSQKLFFQTPFLIVFFTMNHVRLKRGGYCRGRKLFFLNGLPIVSGTDSICVLKHFGKGQRILISYL